MRTRNDIISRQLSRRRLVQRSAQAGALGVSGLLAARSGSALAGPRRALPARQGSLSGTITVSYADELGVKPPYVEAAAEAVTAANPDANVEIDLQKIAGADYYTKLLLALDAGDSPDVIHVGGDKIGEMAEAGYIHPLDEYVAEWPDWEQYPEAIRNGVTYKGSVWAIPYGLDTRFLYFRRDIMEQVGLGRDWEPADIAAMLEAANTVKAEAPDVLPYALYAGEAGAGGTAAHAFIPLVIGYGGTLQNAEGQWIGASAAIDQAFAFYEEAWRTDEVVPQELLTTTSPWTSMREKMGTGELALLFEGGWVYGGWISNDPDDTAENIGYTLHPTADGSSPFTIGGPGTVWYISADSENKDLAWEFITAFNNAETVAEINIEDPHPVARRDSAAMESFQENQFLVDSTESLVNAYFIPPDPNLSKMISVIQSTTGRVAAGDLSAEEASARFLEEMQREIGEENVAEA